MRVTVLGCGGSSGVPQIDVGWGRCDPKNPKNQRFRSSILIETDGDDEGNGSGTILVDTSPDLRQQLLAAGVRRIDAILYTHAHADHIHGLDDLRPINKLMGGPVQAYADADTLKALDLRFNYAFLGIEGGQVVYRPWLIPNELDDAPFRLLGQEIIPFEQDHGWITSIGYRIGDFAYSTDVVDLADEAFDLLQGVKVWMIGCLSDKPHPTHAHVDLALEWIDRVKPARAYLTHMGPGLDYEALKAALPDHVEPAYDGLVISV